MTKKETAAELMDRLRADPIFAAQEKERDAAFQRKKEDYARAEAPLVRDLRVAGVEVGSVWDLVNAKNIYAQSLPILLKHLQQPYPDAIRDGIARSMAVPGAKFAWPLLVRLYKQEQEERTKDGLAVALSNIADDEVIGDLIALAREPQHGASRILLLDALRRSRLPQARQALMEFGSDPLLQKEAQRILRRLKSAE